MIDTYQYLKEQYEVLIVNMDLMYENMGNSKVSKGGVSNGKASLREGLETRCLTIMSSLEAFLQYNPTVESIEGLGLSPSRLKAMRELELLGLARRVQGFATEHVADLGPYGTTAGDIAAFATAADAFEGQMDSPKKTIEARSKARQELTRLTQANRKLAKGLDTYMRVLWLTHPQVYSAFKQANKLGKLPTRHMALRVMVKDAKDQPLPDVTVTLEMADLSTQQKVTVPKAARHRTSKAGGIIKYQNLPDGKCTITATPPNGEPQSKTVNVFGNERVDVVFEMPA